MRGNKNDRTVQAWNVLQLLQQYESGKIPEEEARAQGFEYYFDAMKLPNGNIAMVCDVVILEDGEYRSMRTDLFVEEYDIEVEDGNGNFIPVKMVIE